MFASFELNSLLADYRLATISPCLYGETDLYTKRLLSTILTSSISFQPHCPFLIRHAIMYPSVRTLFLAAMLPFILCVPDRVTATNEPSSCVTACSIWSQVLGFCEGPFGTNCESFYKFRALDAVLARSGLTADTCVVNAASQQGVAAANAFISCLCMGNMQDQAVGNQSFSAAISTCGGCFTTPQVIQDQLSVSA